MNSKSIAKYLTTVILTITAALWPAGCKQSPDEAAFYERKIAPERLREIKTLQLKSADTQKQTPADANAPMPAELELTLQKCRALALENNLDLKVQLISPAIAAQQVTQAEAQFEAAFFSNLSYNKTDTPVASTLDIAGSQRDYSYTDLGVQIPLRTGGDVTFRLADQRTKTDSEYAVPNPAYGSDFAVSISQPLLRNAGRRANTHAIRIAQYQRQITEAQTKLEVIRVIAAVDRLYWRLYAARRELQVRKAEYDLANAQLAQARRFVQAGERPQVEVLRAETGLAQRLEAIIIAENSLRDRQRELKRIINKVGLQPQSPTILIPATLPDPVRYELSESQLVETAIENRMEMLELELQIARDISSIDFQRNQALPLVTLDYTYNISGLGPTRSDSFDLLEERRFADHRLGLSLLLPLGNSAAASSLRQAFYQRRQRIATRRNRRALIELEVLKAIDQLEAHWQRILAARQNAILAGRLVQAEKKQFELGLGTSTDVLDEQAKFADAQSAEILALTEYQIAQVDLAFATGTLLGAAKVRWQPDTETTASPSPNRPAKGPRMQ